MSWTMKSATQQKVNSSNGAKYKIISRFRFLESYWQATIDHPADGGDDAGTGVFGGAEGEVFFIGDVVHAEAYFVFIMPFIGCGNI